MEERIIINNHIQGDPLSEENLDKTLNFANRFRLLLPSKTIWLYTGYKYEEIMNYVDLCDIGDYSYQIMMINYEYEIRQEIISKCDILVDGRYIDSQRNISAKWKGSDNQRVIDIKESIKQNKLILYCD